MSEMILKVGEKHKFRSSFLAGKYLLYYAGLVNDYTYSIVINHLLGQSSTSFNLYLPVEKREFDFEGSHFDIYEVNKDIIRFKESE